MSTTLVILGMGVITYAVRYAGLRLTGVHLRPFWLAFLRFVPVAVFAALVTPSLAGEQGEGAWRVLAAAAAGVVMWRSRQLWLGLLVGMVVFWALRNVG